MGKFKDLTGQRFGKLIVLKELKGTQKVLCRCDCGNEKIIWKCALTSGDTKSCISCENDLTGRKFGILTPIEYIKGSKGKAKKWRCLCDCGKERIVTTGMLLHGQAKSCGCYRFIPQKVSANKFITKDDYMEMYSSKDKYLCKFDIDDYGKISIHSWQLMKNGYLNAYTHTENGTRKTINIARFIMDAEKTELVDHINGDKSDNRKINLRTCNNSQNSMNMKIPDRNKSGMKGVRKITDRSLKKPWYAYITVSGKVMSLGYYESFEEACKARIKAEQKYFGEYSIFERDKVISRK